MTPWVLARASLGAVALDGSVVVTPVRNAEGRVVVEKGTLLTAPDRDRLAACAWDQLHLVRMDPGDLLEIDACGQLAHAVAGAGVQVGSMSGGQWPLRASWRGVLQVNTAALAAVNSHQDLSVYTLFDGQVVDRGEVVGCAKVIPFVVPGSCIAAAVSVTTELGAPIMVRSFRPYRVAAVVLEGLGESARHRFAVSFGEKVGWFGGSLSGMDYLSPDPGRVGETFQQAQLRSDIIVVAGTRAMDPLDPAFVALDRLGATSVRRGMPAHPGSLCWIAQLGQHWVVGLPSCGVLSQATIFDLILTWLFADMPISQERLAATGHGGLLTRDMAYRFPPYRAQRERGEVV